MAAALRSRPRLRHLECAPPERVADGVWLIRGGLLRNMNAYLVEEPDGHGVTVFDTGEHGMAPSIALAAQRLGGIRRILLGHGDTDHRGSAPRLSTIAEVHCHPDAAPYASGDGGREYWKPELLPPDVRLTHAFTHRFVWDGGPVRIDETLSEGASVAGFEVIDLAGHAPGQIGLWRESDGVALVSDTIYVTDMRGRPQEPSVPVETYNFDTNQARQSVRKLAALGPKVVLPGHLGPVTGPDLTEKLEAAATRDA